MSLRSAPGRAKPGYPQSSAESQAARRRALERAYPLAKQLAEVLELEAIEPMATSVKHVRQAIGAELAEHAAMDPLRLDPAEVTWLTARTIRELEEDEGAADGG